jgi:hypothetical protein
MTRGHRKGVIELIKDEGNKAMEGSIWPSGMEAGKGTERGFLVSRYFKTMITMGREKLGQFLDHQ